MAIRAAVVPQPTHQGPTTRLGSKHAEQLPEDRVV